MSRNIGINRNYDAIFFCSGTKPKLINYDLIYTYIFYKIICLSIDHNIDVQLDFSWALKLARNCESKRWFPCGADGRLVGIRSRDYQIFWGG